MIENRNTILAVILSGLVLIAWQYFYNIPHHGKAARRAAGELAQKQAANPAAHPARRQPGRTRHPRSKPEPPTHPGAGRPRTAAARETAIAASPRVKIDTPNMSGSIALKGARIDDVALVRFRETVDPKSPAIDAVLAIGHQGPVSTPSSAFVPSAGSTVKMPTKDTVWTQEGAAIH
jgi:YidC/Oxa1 family membrane protein insertase